eukprot:gene12493-6241_t
MDEVEDVQEDFETPIFDNLLILSDLNSKNEVEIGFVGQLLKISTKDRETILKKSVFEKIEFITENSNDEKFLSSKKLKEIYSIMLKNICLRALKKESFGEEKDGLILFGPEKGMKCLSYNFQVKDKFTKGKFRIFNLTILHSNIEKLTYSWKYLEQNIMYFTSEIQLKSKIQYNNEKKEMSPSKNIQRNLEEILNLPDFYQHFHMFSSCLLKTIVNGVEIRNQYSTLIDASKKENEQKVTSFYQFFELIKQYKKKENPKNFFQKILYNVLVGNQLVIRSNDVSFSNDILQLFMKLVPEKCVATHFGSEKYRPMFLNNFLTLKDDVILPENEIDYHSTFLLNMQGNHEKIDYIRIRNDVERIPITTLGEEYMKLLTNPFLLNQQDEKESINLIEDALIESIKNEWIQ